MKGQPTAASAWPKPKSKTGLNSCAESAVTCKAAWQGWHRARCAGGRKTKSWLRGGAAASAEPKSTSKRTIKRRCGKLLGRSRHIITIRILLFCQSQFCTIFRTMWHSGVRRRKGSMVIKFYSTCRSDIRGTLTHRHYFTTWVRGMI